MRRTRIFTIVLMMAIATPALAQPEPSEITVRDDSALTRRDGGNAGLLGLFGLLGGLGLFGLRRKREEPEERRRIPIGAH
jgi:LPXTG-motif cell wall-anchored protein